jgi:chromosome segregation ATPase
MGEAEESSEEVRRLSEACAALVQREKKEEASRLDAAPKKWQSSQARRVGDERAAAGESERAEQARLLKATVETWQGKLDAAAKAYAEETQAREARHTAALGTLVEAVQRERTATRAAEERTGELRKAAQEAQRQEAARAAMVVQLQEEVARLRMERASALAERVARLEQEKATRAIERENLAAHLRQIEESHREAMRRAETRLDEAEARLRSTRARLAATREGWKKLSEGADRAAEGLKAALQARALEGTAHAQAVSAWEAHRATIEARIAELERATGPVSSARRPRRPLTVSAGRVPEVSWQRAENSESAPPGFETSALGGGMNLAASPTEAANGTAGRSPEGGFGEGSQQFVPWEYGRVVKGDLQEKRNLVQSFLKGVARRIRRK